ncbi:MAG: T9SS type A sorting domain-containing protein [Flavobacteriales bacterium]|nr:T9SS type A sorting domain-containing protein [Flavobacteriales bacterium]
MKNILIILIGLPFFGFAQTGPGGVGNLTTNEIWLPVEGNCYTDAGVTLGGNSSNIQQWNDISGNTNNAIQTTSVNKPNLNTNALNGFSTLTFNGTSDRVLSSGVNTNSQVTIFVVVQFNVINAGNPGIIQASPAGIPFSLSLKSIGMWVEGSTGMIWGRGIQTDNSIRNIAKTTALTTGQFYVITQDYNGTLIEQYIDGTLAAGTTTYNNTLKDWSDFGIGRQGGESLDGDLSEIIVHRVSLNLAERIITENYLAAKYGLSLSSNDLYNEDNVANGNYDYEVAGIGQASDGSNHTDAQGTGIVRINNPSNLDDDEFLIWGHDNGAKQATETTDVPVGVQARFDRVWRASEVNTSLTAVDVGNIDIRWDLTGLGSVTLSDLRLLIDTDNDGVFTDETIGTGGVILGATLIGGNIYQFTGVSAIANNLRFTLGTINTSQTPLPIELINFTVSPLNSKYAQLDWQTASEINNDYFTIERSQNGIDWESIKTINGAGNSSVLLNYSAIDYGPYTGTSYYRLKQTDFNGHFTYSNVEVINFEGIEIINIFPNPNNGSFNSIINSTITGTATINIYDNLGEMVFFEEIEVSIGFNQISINANYLSSGNYFFKVMISNGKYYDQEAIILKD